MAQSFRTQLGQFSAQLMERQRALFANVASAAKFSITDGSPLTGAPGQPVDTGALKASWQLDFPSPSRAEITTNLVYAPPNEDGITADGRPYNQRSPVGGRHSVRLTAANIQNIVNDEARKLG